MTQRKSKDLDSLKVCLPPAHPISLPSSTQGPARRVLHLSFICFLFHILLYLNVSQFPYILLMSIPPPFGVPVFTEYRK